MKTYQELVLVGAKEDERGLFCRSAVNDFMRSADYRRAKDGQAYYDKHNTTIEKYRKMLRTLSGATKEDIFSANYKLKSLIFRRLVTQQVQYVEGNGLTLNNPENKKKLGRDFDYKMMSVSKKAMAQGRAFGFWNVDHVEVFGYADTDKEAGFCPLYDENTGVLRAGIRYWFKNVGKHTIFNATLYEEDGFTEYRQKDDDEVTVAEEKRAYILNIKRTDAGGIEEIIGENHSFLPIVPMYANDVRESELVGIRESIDCYDFVKSEFGNQLEDNATVYWILKNTGGMDDVDLAQFLQRLKTVRAAAVDSDSGVDVDAHTIDIPVEARKTMLEILRKDIYEDFQALDVEQLSASAKTATEIQAAYQSQDNKCADFEYYVREWVEKILVLAGIDDEPSFVWNKVVNMSEQTNMILSAAPYLTEEFIIKHLPFLTPEEADIAIASRDKETFEQFGLGGDK